MWIGRTDGRAHQKKKKKKPLWVVRGEGRAAPWLERRGPSRNRALRTPHTAAGGRWPAEESKSGRGGEGRREGCGRRRRRRRGMCGAREMRAVRCGARWG